MKKKSLAIILIGILGTIIALFYISRKPDEIFIKVNSIEKPLKFSTKSHSSLKSFISSNFKKKFNFTLKDSRIINIQAIEYYDKLNRIIILANNQKAIAIVDPSVGKILSFINNYGKGPDEYEHIFSFYVYDDYLFVYCSFRRTFFVYNLEGNFVKKISLSKFIKKTNLENFVLSNFIYSERKFLLIFNDALNINSESIFIVVDSSFYNPKNFKIENFKDYISLPPKIVALDNHFLFASALSDKIYKIDKTLDSIEAFLEFEDKLDKATNEKLKKLDPSNEDDLNQFLKLQTELPFLRSMSFSNNRFSINKGNKFLLLNLDNKMAYEYEINFFENLYNYKVSEEFTETPKGNISVYPIFYEYFVDKNKETNIKFAIFEPKI